MKVKVAVPVFKDRLTGIYHKQGDTLDVSQERFDEIRKKGPFVEPVQVKSSKPKPKRTTDAEQSEEEQPAEEPEPDPDPEPLHSVEGLPYIEDIRDPRKHR